MRIVEYAAAAVVDEALRQRALGDDTSWVSSSMWKYSTFSTRLGLHDRHAVDQVLGLDQHAAEMLVIEVHGVMRRNPQVAPRHVVVERAGLDADRQNILPPMTKRPL